MLLVDRAHKCSGWRKNLVDEDEDSLLWGKLDALADYVDELTDGEISWHQVLLLVDGGDIRLLDLLADNRDAIGVLLADPLSLRLSLGELVLVLELGSHVDKL